MEKKVKCPECLVESTVGQWNAKTALEVVTDWYDTVESIGDPNAKGFWICPNCGYEYHR